MKVLVIRFSSIGDIVLTTPVIRTLKTQLDAEVHFGTKLEYLPMLQENPYLHQIHLLDGSLKTFIQTLKAEKFDQIIDLHNNLRTRIVKQALGKPAKSFNKLNWQKWLMVNFKINRLPNRHIVDRYMDTVAHLGIKTDELGLEYFLPDKDVIEWDWLPASHRKEFVAVAIGAKFATKRLPEQRLIELCDRINKPIVLLGGKEDEMLAEAVEQFFLRRQSGEGYEDALTVSLNKKTVIFNAVGKCNFNQSASLIRMARWVFTHDTGLMHVAAAFNKPIYSIWGNTIPGFGMYPYRTKFTVFENNKLGCRPCSKIGFAKCPKGHFKCMKEVNFDFYLPD